MSVCACVLDDGAIKKFFGPTERITKGTEDAWDKALTSGRSTRFWIGDAQQVAEDVVCQGT